MLTILSYNRRPVTVRHRIWRLRDTRIQHGINANLTGTEPYRVRQNYSGLSCYYDKGARGSFLSTEHLQLTANRPASKAVPGSTRPRAF